MKSIFSSERFVSVFYHFSDLVCRVVVRQSQSQRDEVATPQSTRRWCWTLPTVFQVLLVAPSIIDSVYDREFVKVGRLTE
jgi:hypothetical protein